MDAQLIADHVELACRWVLAALFIPEQPDEFWAELHAGFVVDAAMFLNAGAVMADWTQPLIEES